MNVFFVSLQDVKLRMSNLRLYSNADSFVVSHMSTCTPVLSGKKSVIEEHDVSVQTGKDFLIWGKYVLHGTRPLFGTRATLIARFVPACSSVNLYRAQEVFLTREPAFADNGWIRKVRSVVQKNLDILHSRYRTPLS